MKTEDRWLTTTEIKKTSKISLGYEMPDLGLGSLESSDYSAQFYFQTPVETDASGHLSKPQVLFTGKVRIVFEGANNAFKAVLHLNSEWIYSSVEWIDAELTVNFPANLEEYFSACSHSSLVLHGLFRSGTWVNKYGVHNLGTMENVGLFDLKEPASQLTLHREEQLKHIFINNLCGGENSGQMPTICREIASNLVNTWTNDRHLELLTTAFDLLTGLRFINTNLDGDMEEKRNSEVSLEQTDFLKLHGEDFNAYPAAVADPQIARKILRVYNKIYTPQDPFDAASKYQYFNEFNLTESIELYLANDSLQSRTLNQIFLECLVILEIRRTASSYLQEGFMSLDTQDCIRVPFYDALVFKTKGKAGWKLYSTVLAAAFENLATLLIVGFISWGMATLLSGESILATYIMFASFFSTWFILRRLNKRDPTNTGMDNEGKGFYNLRRLCSLHNKIVTGDTQLIRTLIADLELHGVSLDLRTYKMLRKMETCPT